MGDEGFKWDNIVKFFDKSVQVTPYNNTSRAQNASVSDLVVADSLQQSGGVKVSWPNFAMPFSSWGIQGLITGGLPKLSGFFTDGIMFGCAYNVRFNQVFSMSWRGQRLTDFPYSRSPLTRSTKLDHRPRPATCNPPWKPALL